MWRKIVSTGMFVAAAAVGPNALADVFSLPAGQVSLSLVPVGDAGNPADPLTGFGAVAYNYQISQFDTTSDQYCAFLNAVAATDPYGLYSGKMFPAGFGTCGIIQAGSSGSFTYSVAPGDGNLPVNEVTWGDAARFCNWLANGQPDTGVENSTTTEDGSYALNGALSGPQLKAVTRSPSATFVIPSENEWYKAAYYKGGSTNAGYWLYPTQNDTPPSNVLSMIGNNNANFEDPVLGFADPVNGLTPVGFFANSPSAFFTYDQGGDLFNWLQAPGNDVIRGGPFSGPSSLLESANRLNVGTPSGAAAIIGFRVVEVPEPAMTTIWLIGAGSVLWGRGRK